MKERKIKINSNIILVIALIVSVVFAVSFVSTFDSNNNKSSALIQGEQIAPHYVKYSEEGFAKAQETGRTLLFFWAPWCGTCSVLDDELRQKSNELPEDLTILKVNFDTQKELKKKYAVFTQHTLVQVDKNGAEIAKWIGGNVDTIKQELR